MPSHWTPEDEARLRPRNAQVLAAMRDAGWVTLEQVAKLVGLRNASTVGSRLRDFASSQDADGPTKAWRYERRRTETKGLWQYRLYLGEVVEVEQLDLPTFERVDTYLKTVFVGAGSQ